jgi:nucleoid DNA-binding protein
MAAWFIGASLFKSYFIGTHGNIVQKTLGFGTFRKVYRKTHMGRNPRTGEKIKIKGRNTVTFKAGKTLREKI